MSDDVRDDPREPFEHWLAEEIHSVPGLQIRRVDRRPTEEYCDRLREKYGRVPLLEELTEAEQKEGQRIAWRSFGYEIDDEGILHEIAARATEGGAT
jgi:hypothetical protein